MSDELRGVVVCHGKLAGALVEAAESISGVTGALVPVSNTGCDRDALEERVIAALDGRPSVVFVDMASGSCLMAVLRRLRDSDGVKAVTGVNLAMLVDFVFHRSLPADEAAARAVAAGTRAIKVP
jgi:mannose/fructose-specific phosphotransferase system component IIA